MIFICALIPLSCVAVALSFGGATSPFAIIQSLVFLPLFGKIGRVGKIRLLIVPICVCSVVLRLYSLYMLAHGAIGVSGGIALIVACALLSGLAAYNGSSAIHSATPLFFISAMLALYVACVSFSSPLRGQMDSPSVIEIISAAVCPLSACIAFSHISEFPPLKRFKGALIGIAVSAVFLIFQSADAEFGFIALPLTVYMSALELKAVINVIIKRRRE